MLLSRRSRAEVSNDASRQQQQRLIDRRPRLRLLLMAFCTFVGGELYKGHFEPGIYVCSKCGHELFSSQAKYEHSSPWPAFTKTIHPDSVSKRKDGKHALKVSCGKCGNGLGHEFLDDGPKAGQSRF